MKSINYPKMFNTLTSSDITKDKEATKNNLKLLLGSEKTTLFGDPYYRIKLKYYMFEQNGLLLKDIIIDEIYSQIKTFIPQVKVNRSDINIIQDERGKLTANIRVTYVVDYTQENYSLVLFKEE